MMMMLGLAGVVLVLGGRMMRMLGLGFPEWSGGVRGVGRLLPCRLFWLGWGRVRPFSVSPAWVGLKAVGLGGRGVGGRGAWLAGPDPVAGVLPGFAWLLSRGCA